MSCEAKGGVMKELAHKGKTQNNNNAREINPPSVSPP
jgi:hypothetical protein